ncbi:glycosyltransferase family 4 protein [Sorangium sp. So ce1024]|uniref:glycosyltransferase family 4 protein n=1 Tax=Sorangium sp. So ce1024 TaxID=3133327 RepID=UPI003F0F053F
MADKKRILFVGSFNPPADGRIGGQYFACRSLIESDLKDDFDFLLVDSTIDTIRASSVFKRLHKVPTRVLRCIRELLLSEVDAVLLFSSSGPSFVEKGSIGLLGKLLGKKVIIFPRSGPIIDNVARSKLYRRYLSAVVRSCDALICQSDYWRRFFLELVPERDGDKLVVIENWLPDSCFGDGAEKAYPRVMDRPLRILYFNRLERGKGIYDFLQAMLLLQRAGASVEAKIYGDGCERDNVQRFISENRLENTEYMGWLSSRKKDVISSFDLCLFTSHSEGFPNALLEVMALGVPVVASRVGAVNDLIEPGRNGFLVDAGSPDQMAQAVLTILREPSLLQEFSRRAIERVQEANRLGHAITKWRALLSTL